MAPLPPNNTNILYIDYVTGQASTSREHTFQVRYNAAIATSTENAQANVFSVLEAMGSTRFAEGWRIVRARRQARNSNISLPVALNDDLAGFVGDGIPIAPQNEALEVTFQGRSQVTGRRVDLSLYGLTFTLPANFRREAGAVGEAVDVRSAVNQLNVASLNDTFQTISGDPPTWYPYANFNFNSYWERALRR